MVNHRITPIPIPKQDKDQNPIKCSGNPKEGRKKGKKNQMSQTDNKEQGSVCKTK